MEEKIKKNICIILVFLFSTLILYIVFVNGRTKNIVNISGALLLSSIYCVLLLFTIRVTNQNCEKRMTRYIWSFLILFSFGVLIVSLTKSGIGWDTWQVYDMSKYVFSDFGYMDQIRQQIVFTHYEMAFPPVFPCLMATVNRLFDIGVYASVFLNAISILLSFVELSKIYKVKNIEVIGCITTVIIFCGRLFSSTYQLGLSQALGYYFLILLCRLIFCERKYNYLFALKCGICCGLLLMNRFDALAIVAVMFLVIPFLMFRQHKNVKEIIKNTLIYLVVVAVVCSPWIIYSISHFNSPFITDNGRRLFNIPDTRPSSFFPENNPALTIKDSFPLWLAAFLGRAFNAFRALLIGLLKYSVFGEAVVVCLCFLGKYKDKMQTIFKKLMEPKFLSVCAIILGQEALFILTGYDDVRYHLPLIFLLQLLTLYYIYIYIYMNGIIRSEEKEHAQ